MGISVAFAIPFLFPFPFVFEFAPTVTMPDTFSPGDAVKCPILIILLELFVHSFYFKLNSCYLVVGGPGRPFHLMDDH